MKDPKYIDRSMDYFEMKYCDTDNLTVENYYNQVIHFQLVRFLKSVLKQTVDYATDTATVYKFIDLLHGYEFINYEELLLLTDYKTILEKENHNA